MGEQAFDPANNNSYTQAEVEQESEVFEQFPEFKAHILNFIGAWEAIEMENPDVNEIDLPDIIAADMARYARYRRYANFAAQVLVCQLLSLAFW